MEGAAVAPVAAVAAASVSAAAPRRHAFEVAAAGGSPRLLLAVESREEADAWLSSLSAAAVPRSWPGGVDASRRPQPLLWSLWQVGHDFTGSSLARVSPTAVASAGTRTSTRAPAHESPFSARLPALRSVPPWQRRALALRKMRACTVMFDGIPDDAAPREREAKRNTLLELADFVEEANGVAGGVGSTVDGAAAARAALADSRFLDDVFTMLRCNLFRALPVAPPPTGDPEEEEVYFSDPQWPQLNVAYELLLRLVSSDAVDLAQKKRLLDGPFLGGLIALFDSEDAREREFLKTIAHRVYSKLTQRRALMRRLIGQAFLGFVLDTGSHRGVAELLEILASVINGFAMPIKAEHRELLMRALLPLHRSSALGAYHAQLSYCIYLYASKDHTLTRDVVPALLRCWPLGATAKQMMLLNELEDLIEYAEADDAAAFAGALALRLARCAGGANFQVAERAMCFWSAKGFCELFVDAPAGRAATLPLLLPALAATASGHWHESIRKLAGEVLARYESVDPALLDACRAELDAQTAVPPKAAPLSPAAVAPPSTPATAVHTLVSAATDASVDVSESPAARILTPLGAATSAGLRAIAASPLALAYSRPLACASPIASAECALALHGSVRPPSVRATAGFDDAALRGADALPGHHRGAANIGTGSGGAAAAAASPGEFRPHTVSSPMALQSPATATQKILSDNI